MTEDPSFRALYARAPAVRADAPGRVNLIGEHTDTSGGWVLPTAIPQRTQVELAPRGDRTVNAFSVNVAGLHAPASYELGAESKRGDWLDYVQGITATLRRLDFTIRGFDLRIASEVPLGSGLSSSAALEIALLRALRQAYALTLDDVELALAGQRAENEFVGAPVGIMDQMASSLALEGVALFLDTKTRELERIRIPETAELVVIDSGVAHSHAGGEYRIRRSEVERAAALLGVPQLRDAGPADLPRIARLPPPLDRRARHVVTENARVLAAAEALRGADLARLGELLDESHESLRVDFEVSTREIDALVALARELPSIHGARITGGGFGGSIVALADSGAGRAAGEKVVARYAAQTHRTATLLVPPPVAVAASTAR